MNAELKPLVLLRTSGLKVRQFLAIVCTFWVYVTLSDVLYANSMRAGIARVTDVPLFVDWDARVLQHVLLLPFLLVSLWASLRVQWRPLLVAVPLQIVLGVVFAAIAYPAVILASLAVEGPTWHAHALQHGREPLTDPYVRSLWLASFVSFLPAYGFGVALVTGLALYVRFQKSELHVAALEREWSSARLAALRMQLSPHTLFNLLHTIRGYIEWDPKGAQAMVVQLADLLRRLLNAGERDLSRLQDELQFARLYLELQQRRFPERLKIALPAQADMISAWVPSLILQPLVENAVVHGLAGHQGPVVVSVSVSRLHDTLTLRVANTIGGHSRAGTPGIGLKNVSERLAVQFEGSAALAAGAHGSEWISEIRLPEIHDSPAPLNVSRVSPLAGT